METISKTSFWLLTIGLFLCNWTNGFCDSIRSVTYSMMKTDVPLSYSQYGSLQSLGLFSYVIWAFSAASLLDSVGYKLTFIVSIVASILGNFLTITSKKYVLIMVSQFFATSLLGVLDAIARLRARVKQQLPRSFTDNSTTLAGILLLLHHSDAFSIETSRDCTKSVFVPTTTKGRSSR